MIKTKRLLIDIPRMSDYQVWKKGRFHQYNSYGDYDLVRNGMKFDRKRYSFLINRFNHRTQRLYIFSKTRKTYFGNVTLSFFEEEIEIGIRILNSYWDRGFARECLKSIRDRYPHWKFCAYIDSKNERSIKCFESIGYRKTETIKKGLIKYEAHLY